MNYFEHNARQMERPVVNSPVPGATDPMATTIRTALSDNRRAEFERAMVRAEAGADVVVEEILMPEHAPAFVPRIVVRNDDIWHHERVRR